MSWLNLIPYFFAAFAILFLPGGALGLALGLRGIAVLSLSGPLSVSIIACTAVLSGLLQVTWGLPAIAVTTVSASVTALAVRFLAARRRRAGAKTALHAAGPAGSGDGSPWSGTAAALIGVAIGGLLIAWRFIHMFHYPQNISQTFDGIFHLNAVEYIQQTGNASSLTIGQLTNPEATTAFYPAAWHALISLLADTGISVPEAINVGNILIAGLLWTSGCVFLVSRIIGTRTIALLFTGVLSAAFSAFPYLMVDFGVLYPNLLAIALMPACLALAVSVAGAGQAPLPGRWMSFVVLGLILPGMLLAHPSTLISFLALTLPLAAWGLVALWKALDDRKNARYLLAFTSLLYLGAVFLLWKNVRPDPAGSTWEPIESAAQAAGEAFLSAPIGRPVPVVVAFLTFAGIVYCARNLRRFWWLLGSFFISCMLFVIVAGFPWGDVRSAFTGVWYNDPYRLAALLPVLGLPMAAVGAWAVTDAIWNRIIARAGSSNMRLPLRPAGVGAAAVVLLLLASTTQGKSIDAAQASGAVNYILSEDSPLLSTDEAELLERVPDQVPEDAMVVGSPWTGAALVYALAGRQTLMPHTFYTLTDDGRTIVESLDDVTEDLSVCTAVQDLNAFYVLDFGPREVHGGEHLYPGLDDVGDSPGFELVDSEGDAKLFRVTVCG